MLTRTLKMAFWVTYDHLGKLLLLNFIAVLAVGGPLSLAVVAAASGDGAMLLVIGIPAVALGIGVCFPVMAVGMAYMAKVLIETRDDASLAVFFVGVRRYAGRAIRLGLLQGFAVLCLSVSVWFYAARLGAALPWLGYGLSALALWVLLLVLLAGMFALPALVQKGAGVLATYKLSVLLVLDNPLFCLGLAVYGVLLAVFAVFPPALMLFSMAPAVVLVSSAYEMLSRKYAPRASAEGQAEIDFKDAEDDYLNRGVRDFLFPWKS